MARCGAPSPWGTFCTRDDDHNDHTNHLAPRWWRVEHPSTRPAVVEELRRMADALDVQSANMRLPLPQGDQDHDAREAIDEQATGYELAAQDLRDRARELEA